MGKYPSIFLLSLLYGHCTLACLIKLFENCAFKETLAVSEPCMKRLCPGKIDVTACLVRKAAQN